MSLPRYPEAIMKLIDGKYRPTIPGPKPKDPTVERAQIPDPDVLYVGPLLDGLCLYAPQLVGKATWPSEGGLDDRRRRMKHLLTSAGAEGRGMNWNARNASVTFLRPSWTKNERSGKVQAIRLATLSLEAEPGELLNSYIERQDPETGDMGFWEFLRKQDAGLATTTIGARPARPFDPLIRTNPKYGLHYLRRGDLITFQFTHRRAGPIKMDFELKSLSEGSSLLTPELAQEVMAW